MNTSLRRKLALELDGVSVWGRGLSAIVIEIAGWPRAFHCYVLILLRNEPATVNTHVPHGAMLKKEKTSSVLLSATGNTFAQGKLYINKNYLYES